MKAKMKVFKWRVAVCDDMPSGVAQLVKELNGAGFEVLTVSDKEGFIDNANKLARCHIAYVDMQWQNMCQVLQEGALPGSLPILSDLDSKDPSSFVAKWISAIESWGLKPPEEHSVASGDWPKHKIADGEVGGWLAALLTHIAPGIQLVFYSGQPGIGEDGFAAAIGRFRDRAYHVETKSERKANVDLALTVLRKHQEKALLRRDIYDWYLTHVLIPKLLGIESSSKELTEPHVHESCIAPQSYDFEEGSFFPQSKKTPLDLLSFYRHDKFDVADFVAFQGLEHDIRDLVFRSAEFQNDDDLIAQLNDIAVKVLVSVPSAPEISGMVWSAAELVVQRGIQNNREFENLINRTWQLTWATLFEPGCELSQLANKHRGEFISTCYDGDLKYPKNEEEMKSRKKKPRDGKRVHLSLQKLDQAVGFLNTNPGTGALNVWENEDFVQISWCGTWHGSCPGIEEFKQLIGESLKNDFGAYRGLPFVLLFGLINGASMRVFLKDAWHLLFDATHGEAQLPESKSHAGEYRFEWVFQKS